MASFTKTEWLAGVELPVFLKSLKGFYTLQGAHSQNSQFVVGELFVPFRSVEKMFGFGFFNS